MALETSLASEAVTDPKGGRLMFPQTPSLRPGIQEEVVMADITSRGGVCGNIRRHPSGSVTAALANAVSRAKR